MDVAVLKVTEAGHEKAFCASKSLQSIALGGPVTIVELEESFSKGVSVPHSSALSFLNISAK